MKREQELFNKHRSYPFPVFVKMPQTLLRVKYNKDTLITLTGLGPIEGNIAYPPGYGPTPKVTSTRMMLDGCKCYITNIITNATSLEYPVLLEFDIQGMGFGDCPPPEDYRSWFDTRTGVEAISIHGERNCFISVLPGFGILPEALQSKFKFKLHDTGLESLSMYVGYNPFLLGSFSQETVDEQLAMFEEILGAEFVPDA